MVRDMLDADFIAELALRLHDEPGPVETIERVCEYALQTVGCDYAGVIVLHKKNSTIETITATDPIIEKLDQIQMDAGEGPDIEVLTDRVSLIVSDTKLERRWPHWAELVASYGIRSLLNVRIHTTNEVLGTLNLYSRRPDNFDTDDQAVAYVIARHAAVAIATARTEENLERAIDARKVIGQAQGILMERFDLDADKAFQVLVRYSQHSNIKLRDIAQTLAQTRSLPKI